MRKQQKSLKGPLEAPVNRNDRSSCQLNILGALVNRILYETKSAMRRILSGGEPKGREIWTDETRCNTLSRMAESLARRTEELHCGGRLCLEAKRWRFDGSTREGRRVGERAKQGMGEQAKQVVENRQSRGGGQKLYLG